MLGKVRYTGDDGREQEIVLHDDGTLAATDDAILPVLRLSLQQYSQDHSPAAGPWGAAFLARVARDHNGKLEWTEKKKPGGEVIY